MQISHTCVRRAHEYDPQHKYPPGGVGQGIQNIANY